MCFSKVLNKLITLSKDNTIRIWALQSSSYNNNNNNSNNNNNNNNNRNNNNKL